MVGLSATVAFGAAASSLPTGENVANLHFGFRLSGEDPSWRPLRVYTDGVKTYIQFPRTLSSGTAPALVALDNDGGWFSSPSEQMVNYRMQVTATSAIVCSIAPSSWSASPPARSACSSYGTTRDEACPPPEVSADCLLLRRGMRIGTRQFICRPARNLGRCTYAGCQHGRVRGCKASGSLKHKLCSIQLLPISSTTPRRRRS